MVRERHHHSIKMTNLNINHGKRVQPPPPLKMMWKMDPQMMPPDFAFCRKCSNTETTTTTAATTTTMTTTLTGGKINNINNDELKKTKDNYVGGGEDIVKKVEQEEMPEDEIETNSVRTICSSDSYSDSSSSNDEKDTQISLIPSESARLSSPSHPSHPPRALLMQSVIPATNGVNRMFISPEESEIQLTKVLSRGKNSTKTSTILETLDLEGKEAAMTSAATPVPDTDETSYSKKVRSQFLVKGICCPMEVPVVRKIVRGIPGVEKIQVNIATKMVYIFHYPSIVSANVLADSLTREGFSSRIINDGGMNCGDPLISPLKEDDELHRGEINSSNDNKNTLGELLSKLHLNLVLSGIFWFLSMISAIGGVWQYLKYAGLLSVLFGLPPIALKAWRTIRRREFDANCMMVIAALGALALQEYDEAASVAFLFAVSEFLEERSTLKAQNALKAIVNLRPDHANVIHPTTKEIVVVPAESVPVGSLISVRTGDKVAADGIVVEGTSSMDESSLTGESVPVLKKVDDIVSGGSINIGTTQLIVRTTSTVEDSAMSRLIQLVEEAQSNRSATEKIVDSFARSYTPLVTAMAAIMCTIPWFFGSDIGHYWTLNGLIMIVLACPCALTISTPVTYAAGLAATAQRGVIVKGGARLEALGAVDTVLFDKTGTLTQGKFSVIHLEHIGETRSRKEMLGLLALMEAPSSHPLSATLVQAAKSEGVSVPANSTNLLEHTVLQGEGVTANVDGKQIYVGNQRLFNRIGMYEQLPQHYKNLADQWNENGGTVGFIGVEGEGISGSFCMIDPIRPEAQEVIDSFHSMGIQVMMLTGDNDGPAKTVAKEVGLPASSVHSELLPEDKLHFVGSLLRPAGRSDHRNNFLGSLLGYFGGGSGGSSLFCQSRSLVLFCGDGVNDGPALSVADVGVSMGGDAAATLAVEASDVTLMDSNLSKLLYVIEMGTRVVRTIRENIIFSLLAKGLVLLLTFLGKITLFAAIASDVGVLLIVTLNGMKLLPSSSNMSNSGITLGRNDRVEHIENEEDGKVMIMKEDNGIVNASSKFLFALKEQLLSLNIPRSSLSDYDHVSIETKTDGDIMPPRIIVDDADDADEDIAEIV